jgi:hypothetical protein
MNVHLLSSFLMLVCSFLASKEIADLQKRLPGTSPVDSCRSASIQKGATVCDSFFVADWECWQGIVEQHDEWVAWLSDATILSWRRVLVVFLWMFSLLVFAYTSKRKGAAFVSIMTIFLLWYTTAPGSVAGCATKLPNSVCVGGKCSAVLCHMNAATRVRNCVGSLHDDWNVFYVVSLLYPPAIVCYVLSIF